VAESVGINALFESETLDHLWYEMLTRWPPSESTCSGCPKRLARREIQPAKRSAGQRQGSCNLIDFSPPGNKRGRPQNREETTTRRRRTRTRKFQQLAALLDQ